jgi:small-conductance mechanosensitive channel
VVCEESEPEVAADGSETQQGRQSMIQLEQHWQDLLASIGLVSLAVVAALVLHQLVFVALGHGTRHTASTVDDALLEHSRMPLRVMAPLAALFLVAPLLPQSVETQESLRHLFGLGIIASVGWILIALTWSVDDVFLAGLEDVSRDSNEARAILTQISIIRRVAAVAIASLTVAVMLLTYPGAQNVGASLLASLGVASIVAGMAARPVLSNLLAGVQIALTQPIRLGDVVVMEGEWGVIEEITTAYVVVRVWDLRRLVVPLTSVIESSFENWTRKTTNIIGTVTVQADYTVPVDEVRSELHRILEGSDLWDREAWGLQVTDAKDRTLELRALMSAADSSALWDLRCLVRERLVGYLQSSHPSALPRLRAETSGSQGTT